MASSLSLCLSAAHPRRFKRSTIIFTTPASNLYPRSSSLSFCSDSQSFTDSTDLDVPQYSSKQVKLCVNEKIPVIPIPGPSALVAGLSASGLATDEFTFGCAVDMDLSCGPPEQMGFRHCAVD
ncbi:hypothetical protein Vadar_025816 [Vaccinium darrowii]|uniref:Uncharacterized protein n=1 Tax=Vaccinium darrowii TaxID=229202 RepID=A0ACB7Y335_9ERIC|nr:hypothetical protein Vadar_025816 [Vaccinium darrowii]